MEEQRVPRPNPRHQPRHPLQHVVPARTPAPGTLGVGTGGAHRQAHTCACGLAGGGALPADTFYFYMPLASGKRGWTHPRNRNRGRAAAAAKPYKSVPPRPGPHSLGGPAERVCVVVHHQQDVLWRVPKLGTQEILLRQTRGSHGRDSAGLSARRTRRGDEGVSKNAE